MESGHTRRKRHFCPSTGTARRFLQVNVGQNMLSRGVNGKRSDQQRTSGLVQALLKVRLQAGLQGARLSTTGDHFSKRSKLPIPKLLSKLYVGAEVRLDCPDNTLECEQRGIDVFNICHADLRISAGNSRTLPRPAGGIHFTSL